MKIDLVAQKSEDFGEPCVKVEARIGKLVIHSAMHDGEDVDLALHVAFDFFRYNGISVEDIDAYEICEEVVKVKNRKRTVYYNNMREHKWKDPEDRG